MFNYLSIIYQAWAHKHKFEGFFPLKKKART